MQSTHETPNDAHGRAQEYLAHIQHMAVAEQARRLAIQGDIRGAAVMLEDLVANSKGEIDPRIMDLAARVRARTGDYLGAQSLWSDALARDPGNPQYSKALQRCQTALRGPSYRFRANVAWSRVITIALILCLVGTTAFQARILLLKRKPPTIDVGKPDHASLVAQVEAILTESDLVPDVTATVTDSLVVTVSGTIPTLEDKYSLEQKFAGIPNVAAVDMSGLSPTPSVIVRPGDTLWSISERWLGSSYQWPLLARINGLEPPYEIHPGDVIVFTSRR